jgi:hypothetical protein
MSFDPTTVTSNFDFQDEFQTTLSGAITSTSTSIPLTLVPTPTEGTLVIEPGTANEEEIYYTTVSGGNTNVPSVVAGRGINNTTAIAHNSGVAVKMLLTSATLQALKNARIIPAGSIAAAQIKAEAWTAWTPTYGGSASMTWGTVTTRVANYIKVGKTVFYRIDAVGTTAGTAASNISFSLPVAAKDGYGSSGAGHVLDASAANSAFTYFKDVNNAYVQKYNAVNYGLGTVEILINGTYEAA